MCSHFCAPQSIDVKSDFCGLAGATWHCSPCSRLVLELKRAESATFSAAALSISPSCSQLLFPHLSRECGRSEGCVQTRRAHTSTVQPLCCCNHENYLWTSNRISPGAGDAPIPPCQLHLSLPLALLSAYFPFQSSSFTS